MARPTAPEAARASHTARRNPRQGVRASCNSLSFRAGSIDSGLDLVTAHRIKADP
ncbi:MAG: hypothetical protein ACNA8O_15930 [Cyanobacteriota bacterium]